MIKMRSSTLHTVFVITRVRCGQTGAFVDSYYYSGKQPTNGKSVCGAGEVEVDVGGW
jgi:hypothetical protein